MKKTRNSIGTLYVSLICSMNSILYLSILFYCFAGIALADCSQSTTSITRRIKDTRDPRISRPRFKPVHKAEIQTLIPLAAAVSKFIATYDRPLSTKRHAFRFVHWRRPTKQKIVTITNRTKYMTKRYYPTKKLYPLKSERRAIIYNHFVNTLSLFDGDKKEQLILGDKQPLRKSVCYMDVYSAFINHCHYAYYVYGGMTQMKTLLARACKAKWLTTDGIIRILQRCCQSRFKYKHIRTA